MSDPLAEAILAIAATDSQFRVGTVTGTASGNRVIVTVGNQSHTISRLANYTPVNTHRVLIAWIPGYPVVLYNIAT